jgi:hypothetical protein
VWERALGQIARMGSQRADIRWAALEAIPNILSAEYGNLSSWLVMVIYMKTDPPGSVDIV